MLALEPQTHEHHDPRAADPSERIHPVEAVAGFGQDLHVGPPVDQERESRANDGERVDEDDTQLPTECRG
jgi:hypothetical protein